MTDPHKRTECHNRRCTQDECVDFRAELREDARELPEVDEDQEVSDAR